MSVRIRARRGRLYLDIYRNGQRHWEALNLTLTQDKSQNKATMRIAEACRAKKEAQILSGDYDLLDPVAKKKTLYAYLEEMGKGRNRRKDRVVKVLPYLAKYRDGGVQLGNVTKAWFTAFQDYLLKDCGLSKSSASSYAYAARMALRKAKMERVISENPADGVKGISVPDTDMDYLDQNEIQRMAVTPAPGKWGKVTKQAFLFGCCTGLRISDLVSLVWGEVEQNPPQIVKRQVKTERKVYIPLNGTAWSIINDTKEHKSADPVFPNLKGNSSSYRFLEKWARESGVAKIVGWHTARRTFAIQALVAGADIYTVSKLLGHTKITTTQVYLKAIDKLKRDAVAALPEFSVTL